MLLDKLSAIGGKEVVQETMRNINMTAPPPKKKRKKKAYGACRNSFVVSRCKDFLVGIVHSRSRHQPLS